MDDIYGNLENYNEVNIIEELKNENKELKNKLKEYVFSLDKLQNEFDKLEREFKCLEINYSSLLKTARAEIERKTQCIKKLNENIDALIIKNNTLILNRSRTWSKQEKDASKFKVNNDSGTKLHETLQNTALKTINKLRRDEGFPLPSDDTLSSLTTDKSDSEHNATVASDHRNTNCKENINLKSFVQDKYFVDESKKGSSIKNRRITMPTENYVHRSIDEEFEEQYQTASNKVQQKHLGTTEDLARSFLEKSYYHEPSHEKPEICRASEKHYNHNSPSRDRDYYYKDHRFGRGKYQFMGKYDERARRRSSPENYSRRGKRSNKDHFDGKYPSEKSRGRNLEAPLLSKSKHRNESRERRGSYETKLRQEVTNRPVNHDKKLGKHKLESEIHDEPKNKRPKYNGHSEIFDEINETEPFISCESPDYNLTEASQTLQVKEIRFSSSSCLEDPRVTSNKYTKQFDGDKIEFISDTGKNVELKTFDNTLWNCPKVPDALSRGTMQLKECLTNDIYKDICDLESISPEPSKILFHSNESAVVIDGDQSKVDKFGNRSKYVKCHINEPGGPENHENCRDLFNTIDKNNLDKIDDITHKELPNVDIKDKESKNKFKSDDIKLSELSTENNKQTYTNKKNVQLDDNGLKSLSNKELVMGDLELSNEKNYNIEYHKAFEEKNIDSKNLIFKVDDPKLSDSLAKNNEQKYNNYKSEQVDNNDPGPILTNKEIVIDDLELSDVKIDSYKEITHTPRDELLDTKKQKIKKSKKRRKSKTKENETNTEKLGDTKNLPNNETSEECVKYRFTDLFGDSSSLITPEELKLATTQAHKNSNNFMPLLEDVQDAVDLNVEDMLMVQTRSIKAKLDGETGSVSSQKTESLTDMDIIDANQIKSHKTDNAQIDIKKYIESVDVAMSKSDTNNSKELKVKLLPDEESETVKTVVISTGFQSNRVTESELLTVEQRTDEVSQKLNERFLSKIQDSIPLNALATSTPHKSLVNNETTVVTNSTNEKCSSLSNIVESNCCSLPVINTSPATAITNAQDTDVPDIRIFVRRRKKFIKKS